jgi:DNA polymerase III epsilon subunit-like protein
MTKYMIFDTETTGLPDRVSVVENNNVHLWPYIVQLSYIIYESKSNEIIKQKNTIIKIPNNIIIPDNVVLIHRITNEMSRNIGTDIVPHLLDFIKDYNNSDIIIGHNILFDINMIRVELLRHVLYDEFNKLKESKKFYCTMKNTIKLCDLKRVDKRGIQYAKYPKLIELHKHLFNVEPMGLHDSYIDILVCFRCYYMIHFNEDVCDKNKTIQKILYKLLC